jgi:peptidoglycan endopeptidase LytE
MKMKKKLIAALAAGVLSVNTLTGTGFAATSNEVLTLTQNLIGKEYTYGGESLSEGFDTSGFVYYVYKQLGVSIPRSMKDQAYMDATLVRDVDKLIPGDIVFFGKSGSILYEGIYIGNKQFVAANKAKDEVIIHSLSGTYLTYFLGARRVAEGTSTTPSPEPSTPTTPPSTPAPPSEPATGEAKPSLSELQTKLMQTAEGFLGTPYLLGSDYGQTATFDCSSFTKTIYASIGVTILRDSRQQSTQGTSVAWGEWEVGDLIFYATSVTGPDTVGHVAMYAGNGKVIHAWPKSGVITSDANHPWFKANYLGSKRILTTP